MYVGREKGVQQARWGQGWAKSRALPYPTLESRSSTGGFSIG